MQQNIKKTMILAGLAAVLTFCPRASFAQAATTFTGEAVALRASALGLSLAVSDTGALPSGGGSLSTSLASVNVAGIASADLLSSSTSVAVAWILRHYPVLEKRMIFGGAKSFLSGPERVLIDDKDENVVDFIAAGGQAVLVPHAWNSAYKRRAHTGSSVRAQLDHIMSNVSA